MSGELIILNRDAAFSSVSPEFWRRQLKQLLQAGTFFTLKTSKGSVEALLGGRTWTLCLRHARIYWVNSGVSTCGLKAQVAEGPDVIVPDGTLTVAPQPFLGSREVKNNPNPSVKLQNKANGAPETSQATNKLNICASFPSRDRKQYVSRISIFT